MSIDFLVKLRDHSQAIADAANEELERKRPTETKDVGLYDPEKIGWKTATGAKGEFQAYPERNIEPEKTPDYISLLGDIKQHSGKLYKNGQFYWVFPNKITIGRKPITKS